MRLLEISAAISRRPRRTIIQLLAWTGIPARSTSPRPTAARRSRSRAFPPSIARQILDNVAVSATGFGGDEDSVVAIQLGGSDVDGTVASFTITQLAANGTLYSDAGLTYAIGQNGTVSASSNAATIYFKPDADWNGTTSLQFAAVDNDGLADPTPATVAITINPVNDAPNASSPTTHYAATEQTNLSLNNTGLSVSDVDGGSGSETVTLSVGEGILTVAAGTSGVTGITGNGSSSVSVSGTLTQLNALLASTGAAGTIVYNDNTDTPAANTTLTLSINDNGNTGSGGALTGSHSSTIDITAVNDPPVVDLNGGGAGNNATASFIEQTPVLVASSATLTDVDLANLASLTMTLTARPDGNAAKLLSLNSAAASAASAAELAVGYTAATGVLSITGSASAATYQTILQGVQYNDTSDTPNTADRTVTVVANDGSTAVTSFQAPVTFATGSQPVRVAAADFNGDGNLDLVVANSATNSVSVYLGNGSGGFGAKTDYGAGAAPYAVAIGDLNGDGRLDIATASQSGIVSVLLGDGSGGFGTHTDYFIRADHGSTGGDGIVIGDFNSDGNPDLAVANAIANFTNVSILMGIGSGTFGASTDYPVGRSTGVAEGDFNGDGKLDLVASEYTANAVAVMLNNGDGTFAAKVNYPTGATTISVATGDFNGDGKLDLVTANSAANTVSVLLGNGDGTFQTKVDYAAGTNPQSVTVADFDGDGKLDLAVANNNGTSGSASQTISLLLGNGDGTFQAKADIPTGTTGQTSGLNAGLAAGDFNHDGKTDLAFVYQGSNNLEVLLNSSTTNLSATAHTTISVTPVNDAPVVSAGAISPSFTTLVDPALSHIQAIGINDNGIIVGQGDLDANNQRGFVYDGTTFTTIDDGGAQDTSAHSITDAGVIIGDYSPSRSTPRYGFIDTNGSFTQIASDSPYPSTNANGINDAGVIVGSDYLHAGARYSGYIYNNGTFTYLQAPGANNGNGDTYANDINNNGVVVGSFNADAIGAERLPGYHLS